LLRALQGTIEFVFIGFFPILPREASSPKANKLTKAPYGNEMINKMLCISEY